MKNVELFPPKTNQLLEKSVSKTKNDFYPTGVPHSSSETDETSPFSSITSEDGSILPVHSNDSHLTHVKFFISRSLAGMHLVCDSREGRNHQRQRMGHR